MNRTLVLVLVYIWSYAAYGFDQSHADWGKVLSRYVGPGGGVLYMDLKQDISDKNHPFQLYLKMIQTVPRTDFENWSANDQKAFLINAYNALTVKLIVDHYPVKGIKDVGSLFKSPWKIAFFKLLDGQATTLDAIEHDVLRPDYKDYRVHAAVNCASISCPELRSEPYLGARLDGQLNEQMRQWLNDSTRNDFNQKTGIIRISKIFDWYRKDFETWGGGVKKVLEEYGPAEARTLIKENRDMKYLDYNWNLNKAK